MAKNLTTAIQERVDLDFIQSTEQQTAELISKLLGQKKLSRDQRSRSSSNGKVSQLPSYQRAPADSCVRYQTDRGGVIVLNAGYIKRWRNGVHSLQVQN